ncbi:unnamed protein product [marine sediment metagenome]|uniref:Uncharacterized protein n=1 Tax=marine sediment metagenome TaxID=412755 RepID=X1TBG1_9ZZZZ
MAQELISVSQVNAHLIQEYKEETIPWGKALITPGQDTVSVKCGPRLPSQPRFPHFPR